PQFIVASGGFRERSAPVGNPISPKTKPAPGVHQGRACRWPSGTSAAPVSMLNIGARTECHHGSTHRDAAVSGVDSQGRLLVMRRSALACSDHTKHGSGRSVGTALDDDALIHRADD